MARMKKAIVYVGGKWWVRRIRSTEHDMIRDEKVYRCDEPISGPHDNLADVPEVAALLPNLIEH